MRYLTIVYNLPDSFDVKQLTEHELVSAMSWSHAIDEKNRLANLIKSANTPQKSDN